MRRKKSPFRDVKYGGVEISFRDLLGLRYSEIPYKHVEVANVPSLPNGYQCSLTVEEGFAKLGVGFDHPEAPITHEMAILWDERITRAKSAFRHVLANNERYSYGGEFRANWFGPWTCLVSYSADIKTGNPRVGEVLRPFFDAYRQRLRGPSDLLVFICYASEDKAVADKIFSALQQRNFPIWYDSQNLRVGDSIVAEIGAALRVATHVIVVLSRASVKKPWVTKEFSTALTRQLSSRSILVLPFLLEPCTVPTLLSDIKYADGTYNLDNAIGDVISAIESRL